MLKENKIRLVILTGSIDDSTLDKLVDVFSPLENVRDSEGASCKFLPSVNSKNDFIVIQATIRNRGVMTAKVMNKDVEKFIKSMGPKVKKDRNSIKNTTWNEYLSSLGFIDDERTVRRQKTKRRGRSYASNGDGTYRRVK